MANNIEIIDQLKDNVNARIKMCNHNVMPYVCNMAKTTKGLNTIMQYVLNLVAQADYSIADALMEKERELNPNMIKD